VTTNPTHADLIALAATWLRRKGCGVVITDMASGSPETPDAIGWHNQWSFLIECKASRSDFLADRKKFFRRPEYSDRAMGSYRYFLAPEGLLKPDEIPRPWGLLEAKARRVQITKAAAEVAQGRNPRHEVALLCSALRRMVCQHEVRGIMCRTYVIERGGEPRATVSCAPEATA
jgi:hypothetical protein